MDIEVFIEGVPDPAVFRETKRSLQLACRTVSRPGQWTVLLSPSETRGEWDLGVRGPAGHRLVSVTTEIDQLPALVGDRLKACF